MTFPPPPYPTVRLLPKAEARAIRHGFPWVYADELVLDRRTRALEPGALAVLEDAERRPLAVVTVNPASKIAARVLDADPAAASTVPGCARDWPAPWRTASGSIAAPNYRLVHGEADGLPGLVIDRFGAAASVQPNAAWADVAIGEIAGGAGGARGRRRWSRTAGGRARSARRAATRRPRRSSERRRTGRCRVEMNGAIYLADLLGGQKTGLFYDQRPNHAFAAALAKGGRVLDVFCPCRRLRARGACRAARGPAWRWTPRHPRWRWPAGRRGDGAGRRFLTPGRATHSRCWRRSGQEGARFGLVVCDPPAFAPSKAALEAGLRAYERLARLAAPLVARMAAISVLCSCSHAADLARFRAASARGIGRAGRRGPIVHTGFAGPDHPVLPQLAEQGYLKALVFRL